MYKYLPGGLISGVTNITPDRSQETSPEQDQPAVEMADEETIDALKRARTAAKSKFTNLRKSLLGLLEHSDVVPVQKIYASEKKLEDAFDSLNEAHREYVVAKYSEEDGLQEAEYMDEPLAECLEAEAEWTKWHNNRKKESQELHRAEKEAAHK